jgi:hypothetical protein
MMDCPVKPGNDILRSNEPALQDVVVGWAALAGMTPFAASLQRDMLQIGHVFEVCEIVADSTGPLDGMDVSRGCSGSVAACEYASLIILLSPSF